LQVVLRQANGWLRRRPRIEKPAATLSTASEIRTVNKRTLRSLAMLLLDGTNCDSPG
jgi:hypothetical protein